MLALRAGRRVFAAAVDEFLGKQEIVIKSLGAFLEEVGPWAGASIGGDGRVVLLLDPARLVERGAVDVAGRAAPGRQRARPFPRGARHASSSWTTRSACASSWG